MRKINQLLLLLIILIVLLSFKDADKKESSWIRINQLVYLPGGIKVEVWCSTDTVTIRNWQL